MKDTINYYFINLSRCQTASSLIQLVLLLCHVCTANKTGILSFAWLISILGSVLWFLLFYGQIRGGILAFQSHSLNEELQINGTGLIVGAHAAPADRGVTRAGLGIICALVSPSVHE